MRWSERQLAMLREIGIRVWAPPRDTTEDEDRPTPATTGTKGKTMGRRRAMMIALPPCGSENAFAACVCWGWKKRDSGLSMSTSAS